MNEEAKDLDLPEDVFRLIRDLFCKHSGIYLDDEQRDFVRSRLKSSVLRRQFDNFRDYYFFLKYDRKKDEELINLIDVLTIHETYFFREEEKLKTFSEDLLPEIAKKNQGIKTLRIWSAGCSTGEEPYSISMLLMEDPRFRDWSIEIVATDISQRVLQSARRGVYKNTSFRTAEPQYLRYLERYFHKEADGYRIDDSAKKIVSFFSLNLLDKSRLSFIGPMDIIFCRNVIIYFDINAKKYIAEAFYKKLRDSGFLVLGHSESLVNISTSFMLRLFEHDLVYQKPAPDKVSVISPEAVSGEAS